MDKKNKEIWFIDQYIGHPKYGNVYRNFYLAEELQKRNIKVRIFSGSYSHLRYNNPIVSGICTTEILDGVEFNWIKIKNYGDGRSIGRVLSFFEFTSKLFFLRKEIGPEVILTPSAPMVPFWLVYFFNKIYWNNKSKIIFEIRDIWPLTLITLGKKKKYHPFIIFLSFTEKVAYKKVDYIVSTLKLSYKHIATITKKRPRFKWIDNGINIPDKTVQVPKEILSLIPTDKFIIGYTGSLGLANAMSYLIEAANLIKHNTKVHFVLVGDGSDKKALMRKAKGLNNITFINKVEKNFIPGILSHFDALYFSYANVPELYKYGVSANKTYEYMISGKPIILSTPKLEYNIIEIAQCGIVIPPENSKSIYRAIHALFLLSPEERADMGKRGKEYIKRNNTFDILGDKLYKVINEVL
ncbi:glycosyltransferase family 4 protein [Salegentibacter salegens]|uniref:Glycosyltransferase involved in cell wall bisynthesis n=1 Tax=Salegentibacter salegens TaxID=143223 RepID=A0A1M7L4U9_9FLAO|nr:glycosyltransferase family 4 protein [Salegentibacter salegens]PRX38728.1 glycosyltransferase involved in cell wall biosynthesis [Salegentibacter salegens]SHM73080.1 Glycosyltransferase involved in cell wall bisynthesis [Salegentibacter salegens]